MTSAATETLVLRTNLADAPQVKAMKDGRVTSGVVKLDYCGPKQAHGGFKNMIRRNAYDAGEMCAKSSA
jgi:4,5-dihydroxyphthalate decarboxylase